MIRKHKMELIVSSSVILFPILIGLILWNKLPETMTTHWGFDGQPDGCGSLPFAVFVPYLCLLAGHWLCILVTAKDPKNQGRNWKPIRLMVWIMPVLSNVCGAIMYSLALGVKVSVSGIMVAAIGLMFIAIGNYLPKCRQNYTIGIKVPWTYTSEENWNATHRFGGRVWMIGGAVMMLCALLPAGWNAGVMIVGAVLLGVIPIAYSYFYYRGQVKRGEELKPVPSAHTKAGKLSLIALALVLALVAVTLFTGRVETTFSDDYFSVKASFYDDLTVFYDRVENVEYREGSVEGSRVFGVGSFRLLLGTFENEEFGNYTRYTYYNPEACVVMKVNGKTLVLSGKDKAETQEIYRQLLERTQ
ncbi:MAG: SdpI family protein [Eubacteriales bacterium]|nr:SdpI family protein [Eubacteriales bacterium]